MSDSSHMIPGGSLMLSPGQAVSAAADQQAEIDALDVRVDALEADVAAIEADYTTKTTALVNYYANGTSGDDANDGLTVLTPKKTLQAVFDLIPDVVLHAVVVNLAGIFDSHPLLNSARQTILHKLVLYTGLILIDMGSDVTTVSGPFTLTGATSTLLTIASGGGATDAWHGYSIKITSGVADGTIVPIHSNTSTTFTPSVDLAVTPGIGDTFVVCRQTTELKGDSGGAQSFLVIDCVCSQGGAVIMQRGSVNGLLSILCRGGKVTTSQMHYLVVGSTGLQATDCIQFAHDSSMRDPASPYSNLASSPQRSGGMLFLPTTPVVTCTRCADVTFGGYFPRAGTTIIAAAGVTFYRGVRLLGLTSLINCGRLGAVGTTIRKSAGFQTSLFDVTTGFALNLLDSNIVITGGSFQSAGSAAGSGGIDVDHSLIRFFPTVASDVAGTSARVGVNIHDLSIVQLRAGISAMSITGTSAGDFTFDNGVTNGGAWTDISASTPIVDLVALSRVMAL